MRILHCPPIVPSLLLLLQLLVLLQLFDDGQLQLLSSAAVPPDFSDARSIVRSEGEWTRQMGEEFVRHNLLPFIRQFRRQLVPPRNIQWAPGGGNLLAFDQQNNGNSSWGSGGTMFTHVDLDPAEQRKYRKSRSVTSLFDLGGLIVRELWKQTKHRCIRCASGRCELVDPQCGFPYQLFDEHVEQIYCELTLEKKQRKNPVKAAPLKAKMKCATFPPTSPLPNTLLATNYQKNSRLMCINCTFTTSQSPASASAGPNTVMNDYGNNNGYGRNGYGSGQQQQPNWGSNSNNNNNGIAEADQQEVAGYGSYNNNNNTNQQQRGRGWEEGRGGGRGWEEGRGRKRAGWEERGGGTGRRGGGTGRRGGGTGRRGGGGGGGREDDGGIEGGWDDGAGRWDEQRSGRGEGGWDEGGRIGEGWEDGGRGGWQPQRGGERGRGGGWEEGRTTGGGRGGGWEPQKGGERGRGGGWEEGKGEIVNGNRSSKRAKYQKNYPNYNNGPKDETGIDYYDSANAINNYNKNGNNFNNGIRSQQKMGNEWQQKQRIMRVKTDQKFTLLYQINREEGQVIADYINKARARIARGEASNLPIAAGMNQIKWKSSLAADAVKMLGNSQNRSVNVLDLEVVHLIAGGYGQGGNRNNNNNNNMDYNNQNDGYRNRDDYEFFSGLDNNYIELKATDVLLMTVKNYLEMFMGQKGLNCDANSCKATCKVPKRNREVPLKREDENPSEYFCYPYELIYDHTHSIGCAVHFETKHKTELRGKLVCIMSNQHGHKKMLHHHNVFKVGSSCSNCEQNLACNAKSRLCENPPQNQMRQNGTGMPMPMPMKRTARTGKAAGNRWGDMPISDLQNPAMDYQTMGT